MIRSVYHLCDRPLFDFRDDRSLAAPFRTSDQDDVWCERRVENTRTKYHNRCLRASRTSIMILWTHTFDVGVCGCTFTGRPHLTNLSGRGCSSLCRESLLDPTRVPSDPLTRNTPPACRLSAAVYRHTQNVSLITINIFWTSSSYVFQKREKVVQVCRESKTMCHSSVSPAGELKLTSLIRLLRIL